MASFIDKAIEKIKEKVKGKEKKNLEDFLKKHKKDFEELGKQTLQQILASRSLDDLDEAIEIHLIAKKSPSELIEDMEKSHEVFEEAMKQMEEDRKRVKELWQGLATDAAKTLLPIIVKAI